MWVLRKEDIALLSGNKKQYIEDLTDEELDMFEKQVRHAQFLNIQKGAELNRLTMKISNERTYRHNKNMEKYREERKKLENEHLKQREAIE